MYMAGDKRMINGKISVEDIIKSIAKNIKDETFLEPVAMDVGMPVSLPMKRNQKKIKR